MSAAIRVIAAEGLGAATATIAKEAGVSNGSLFTYFETKAELLNRLYVELKTEMAAVGLEGLPTRNGLRKQAEFMWSHLARLGGILSREAPNARAAQPYRMISPRRVARPAIAPSQASRIFLKGAANVDRCETRRWRSSLRYSTRTLTRRSTS